MLLLVPWIITIMVCAKEMAKLMRQETRHHHVVISWIGQISEKILIATQPQTFTISKYVLTMII